MIAVPSKATESLCSLDEAAASVLEAAAVAVEGADSVALEGAAARASLRKPERYSASDEFMFLCNRQCVRSPPGQC